MRCRGATRKGSQSRRAVGAALGFICPVAALGCSIEFVALEERPIATLIQVRSEHYDGLRVTVDIEHIGPTAAIVRIDGEPMTLDGPDGSGHYVLHFEAPADPLVPVVNLEFEQLPGAPIAVHAPLLVRSGEATCEADGDVRLPARLDALAGDGLSRSWTVVLLDEEGDIAAVAQTKGSLPDPLVVPAELMSDSTRAAQISVRVVGNAQEVPAVVHFDLRTEAEWGIPGPCA